MLRLTRTQSLKCLQQLVSTVRTLSVTSSRFETNDDGNGGKTESEITSEKSTSEPTSLENTLTNLLTEMNEDDEKENTSLKTRENEKSKSETGLRNKKDTSKLQTRERADDLIKSFAASEKKKEKKEERRGAKGREKYKSARLENIKRDLEEKPDLRDITKLMSFLTDDDATKTDEDMSTLMDSMIRQTRTYDEQKYKSIFNNPPTVRLFPNYKDMKEESPDRVVSLHERNSTEEFVKSISVPKNNFEVKMLDMDRQWEFPIDNQQDMVHEQGVSFEQHVFLDHYLDEFPQTEPILKYMELVLTGLQQNPYLTVDEKVSKIMWYKEYFEKFPEEQLS